jgi:hypothetical protein
MTAMRPADVASPQVDPAERAQAAVTELLAALSFLFAIAANRQTHRLATAHIHDIELAYSRLGRLVALLRSRRVETSGIRSMMDA